MTHSPADSGRVPSPSEKADALYQNYLAGGPDAAYASLKKDYDACAGMRNRDDYFKEVAADLEKSGHMPNMAIGWLKAEQGRLAEGDGVVYKQDILKAESNGGLDAIFGKVVLTSVPSPGDNRTFFDQVAHTKKAWSENPDGIEAADLRKYSRQMHRAERHDYNRDETADAAEPLFRNNGELLSALDTGPHGERNGVITGHEMKRFLDEYKKHPGEGAYTRENAEYVNELLHNDIGRVTKHGRHGFVVSNLERRAGISEDDTKPPTDGMIGPPEKPSPPAPETDPRPEHDRGHAGERPPGQNDDKCVDLEVRKNIDMLSRVQPGEGYNAVAARLLEIHPGHKRTAEEVQQINILGQEIAKMNGAQSTFHLRTGVVLPVSANLELLMEENPTLKASVEKMRVRFSGQPEQPPQIKEKDPAKDTEVYPNC